MIGTPKLTGFFKRFVGADKGSIFIMSSTLIPLFVMVIGATIEYSNFHKQRAELQSALDAALLDSIWANGLDNAVDTLEKRLALEFENINIKEARLIQNNDDTAELSAKVEITFDTYFKGVLGEDSFKVYAESAVGAVKKLSSIKFTPISAQGGYPKKAELIVKRAGQPETVLTTMYYKVAADKPVCRRTGKIDLIDCGEIELGNYERAYLRFSIWEYNSYIRRGDRRKATNIVDSDDPNNARRFFIDGVQQSDGTSVDVFSSLECDRSSHHAWEDLRNVRAGDKRDFIYTVTGYCEEVDPTNISLLK